MQERLEFKCGFVKFVADSSKFNSENVVIKRAFLDVDVEPRGGIDSTAVIKALTSRTAAEEAKKSQTSTRLTKEEKEWGKRTEHLRK